MDKIYRSKGYMAFVCTEDGLKYGVTDKADELKNFNGEDFMHQFEHRIYDLMDGKEFYKCVDCGGFIDYDGGIADIFVDGYKSNLGLWHAGLCSGKFLVDGETFLDICDEFKVEVNWANK